MNLCKKCKTHLVLGSLGSTYGDMEVIPDDEPYVADMYDDVIVDDMVVEEIKVGSRFGCHICPECCTVDSVWVEES